MASSRGATHAREGRGVLLLGVGGDSGSQGVQEQHPGRWPAMSQHCQTAATALLLSLQWGQ